ncbi:MAG: glycosyltransferase family 9 protein [Candidatus Edwardsbacteria bacterium]|nr:glycosyltransferase family 9 protein [Candidatus Edwardsbacteria bacterium]
MSDKPVKILVVRQDRLGDAINAVPVLKAIRKAKPEAFISFMTAQPLVELFAGQPYLDQVVSWGRNFFCLVHSLRQGRYEALLMLHPSKILAWAAFFAGIKQKAGLGFRPYYVLTGFKPAHIPQNDRDVHETEYNLSVARQLWDLPEQIEPPRIFLSEQEMSEARNILMSMGVQTPIAILPANRGSSANWPPEKWGELVRKLVEAKQEVLILGGPGEEDILKKVKGDANVPIAGPELTLRRLAAILANCRQVAGSSTGTLHLAAAAGAKTVGLFCPAPASRPERWRPLGEGHVQLVPEEEYCRKCQPHAKCDLKGIAMEEILQNITK